MKKTIQQRVSIMFLLVFVMLLIAPTADVLASRPTLYWGSTGSDVKTLQWRLNQWGYYQGAIDGVFGAQTHQAVRWFQSRNGLRVDGVVGRQTWQALGLWTTATAPAVPSSNVSRSTDVDLLARVVSGEARAEPFEGQVAVAAVVLNRIKSPEFPNSLSGVVYQPHAFESVTNGQIWAVPPSDSVVRATQAAMNGWDPTYGSIFFWNPSKPVNPWVWSRTIVTRIGNHVFAK